MAINPQDNPRYQPKNLGLIQPKPLNGEGIKSALKQTGQALIGQKGLDQASNLIDTGLNTGKQAVQGLGAGIKTGVQAAVGTAEAAGNRITDNFNASEYGALGGLANVGTGLLIDAGKGIDTGLVKPVVNAVSPLSEGIGASVYESLHGQQPSLGASSANAAKTATGQVTNQAQPQPLGASKQNPNSQDSIFNYANTRYPSSAVDPEQAANAATDQPAAGVTMDQSRYNKTGPMRPITTFNDGLGGSASVQFADGRTLNETQQNDLQRTIARNADPAVQAKFAKEAEIVQGRHDRAKAFDVAQQREQQEAILNNQIQSARNTLLQPAITGDLFAMLAQNQNKKAAEAFLGIGNDSRQVDNQRLANDQENQIRDRHYLFEEQSSEQSGLAEAAKQQAEAQQRQFENNLKMQELNKPSLQKVKFLDENGLESEKVQAYNPMTGQPIQLGGQSQQPVIKYDSKGNAYTKDQNGNIIPYQAGK